MSLNSSPSFASASAALNASTRRDFLKKAMLLAGGAAETGLVPEAIRQAVKIDPAPGTTWKDAEHVVILMQENRSFDHCFGTLRGVRGFDDPRAVRLPNGNPVWLQTNAEGETFVPFRLNIRESRATWMGCLPHGAGDQAAARNGGTHDAWLDAKRPAGRHAHMPMTLGYYTREDLPFYHALADAFTICDQNFCSSLTGTTPNRLHLWSGTIREDADATKRPAIHNSDADHKTNVGWRTLPELLQDAGVSWKVYQNEIDIESGLDTDEHDWLANFGDNPLEYFSQYHVKFHPSRRRHLVKLEATMTEELAALGQLPPPLPQDKAARVLKLSRRLESIRAELAETTEENFAKLPVKEQELHRRAFDTNGGDPQYRALETMAYDDAGTPREMQVPKGDVLHQFRQDVHTGALPTVSWMVAPRNFCDHPDAPWYGSWYVAEAMDILTKNPEVWKKTIFILCYDENDGLFDHVPPFVPPVPHQPRTGLASTGLDTTLDHNMAAALAADEPPRSNPIGLGYRVPLVIASPWSRGGFACSQVFDHTSIARFVELFASHRSGREIRETNISPWRRAICGDLTSAFRPWNGEAMEMPSPVARAAFLGGVHQAQFRELPGGFHKLSRAEIQLARENPRALSFLPRQEPGGRPSCALPCEFDAHGALSEDGRRFEMHLAAGNRLFGKASAGGAFQVHNLTGMRVEGTCPEEFVVEKPRSYSVIAGDALAPSWKLEALENERYHFQVHGPNGFFREFQGGAHDPALRITLAPEWKGGALSGNLLATLENRHSEEALQISLEQPSYAQAPGAEKISVPPQTMRQVVIATAATQGWHDVVVRVGEHPRYVQRFAGRLETGRDSVSDPLIGWVG